MSAGVFYTGAVELFVKPRSVPVVGVTGTVNISAEWWYLGASVLFPTIEERVLHRELKCDRSGDASWQKVSTSESHVVTAVLNRLNFETLNVLRGITAPPAAYSVKPGKLVMNSKDCQLFIRYANPNVPPPFPLVPPTGTAKGRLYYSASLEMSRLAQPSRAQEVGLVFECNQLWNHKERKWLFWSEADADLPTVTPE